MLSKLSVSVLLLLTGIVFLASCSKKDNGGSPVGPTPPPVAAEVPVVKSFTPATGVSGSSVTITGSRFGSSISGNAVTFNGKTATIIEADDSSLVVTVPVGAGIGKISVRTAKGVDSSATDFNYIATVSTFAGDGNPAYKDGTGAGAELNSPWGLAFDASGNLIVADIDNNRIRKITPAGVVSTVAGDGTAAYRNGTAGSAEFSAPEGVAIDASGNIIVADLHNDRIRMITPAGVVSTLAGNGTYGDKDTIALYSEFFGPSAVALDASGNIYVADYFNDAIRKITPGGIVGTLGSYSSNPLYSPIGVAVDASGNVYVADAGNNRIRKITAAGVGSTLAGDGTPGLKDSTGAKAKFNYPIGVALDAAGNVYVADTHNNLIRKITPAGVVSTLAGDGTQAFKDGPANTAEFDGPVGIAVDASGAVYVADGSNRIRKIQ